MHLEMHLGGMNIRATQTATLACQYFATHMIFIGTLFNHYY